LQQFKRYRYPMEASPMQTLTITNPTSNRANQVNAWEVNPKALYAAMTAAYNAGKPMSAKDITWLILDTKETAETAAREDGGDAASNNLGLSIFEGATDWGIGIAALGYIRAVRQQYGRKPKAFKVAANRKGDCFIICPDGTVLAWG
jgi:hypothetical protein